MVGALIAIALPCCAAFIAPMRHAVGPSALHNEAALVHVRMGASRGPFKVPGPPSDFAGAQWAPHVFKPFPINVQPAAESVKELLRENQATDSVQTAPAPLAPASSPAPPAADKSTFSVLFKTPDGDKS